MLQEEALEERDRYQAEDGLQADQDDGQVGHPLQPLHLGWAVWGEEAERGVQTTID